MRRSAAAVLGMRPGGLLPIGRLLIRYLLVLTLQLWGEIAGAQSAWNEVPAGDAHRSGAFQNLATYHRCPKFRRRENRHPPSSEGSYFEKLRRIVANG